MPEFERIAILGAVGGSRSDAGRAAGLTLRCRWRVDDALRRQAAGEPVRVGVHVRDEHGADVLHNGPRSLSIPTSGSAEEFFISVNVPEEAGVYLIDLDPVVENRFWASWLGFDVTTLRIERLADRGLRLPDDLPVLEDTEQRRAERLAFWRIARRFTPIVAVDDGPARFLVSTDDDVVGGTLFADGRFVDVGQLSAACDVLAGLGIDCTAGRTLVDVGANIGTTTVNAILQFGFQRVVAIEPDPENVWFLRQNVHANALTHRVTVVPAALSDRVGTVDLERAADNSGDHRVRVAGGTLGVTNPEMYGESGRPTLAVEATTFDALVRAGTVRLDVVGLVWIDTQGHEGQVFQGASSLLRSGVPVVSEYWPYGLARAGGLDLFERLVMTHFSHFVLLGDGPGDRRPRPVAEVAELRRRYSGQEHADLLFLSRPDR